MAIVVQLAKNTGGIREMALTMLTWSPRFRFQKGAR